MDALLEVTTKINAAKFGKLKEDDDMAYKALVRLMKPEIDAMVKEATDKATEEVTQQVISTAVESLVEAYKGMSGSMTDAVENLMRHFGMEREAAMKAVEAC